MGETPIGLKSAPRETAEHVSLDGSSAPNGRFVVTHVVRTHVGLVRDHNEDDFLIMPDHGLYLVADGMGGHAAGKVASEVCVRTVEAFFNGQDDDDTVDRDTSDEAELPDFARSFAHSLRLANRRIFEASTRDRALAGMGTTGVGVRVQDGKVAICHAGDSRCYLHRHGRLEQVTNDHSLSNFLLALGRELEAQMAEATMSNVIMRALGLEPEVAIESRMVQAQHGDRFLLCSDGLSDLVARPKIERLMGDRTLARAELGELLIAAALEAGGRDNVTVLVVDIEDAVPSDRRDDTAESSSDRDGERDTLILTAPPPGVRLDEALLANARTTEHPAIAGAGNEPAPDEGPKSASAPVPGDVTPAPADPAAASGEGDTGPTEVATASDTEPSPKT